MMMLSDRSIKLKNTHKRQHHRALIPKTIIYSFSINDTLPPVLRAIYQFYNGLPHNSLTWSFSSYFSQDERTDVIINIQKTKGSITDVHSQTESVLPYTAIQYSFNTRYNWHKVETNKRKRKYLSIPVTKSLDQTISGARTGLIRHSLY